MIAAIGDNPPPPPGYDSVNWRTGTWDNGKTVLRDLDSGDRYTIHPEDGGHWRHWDVQDKDGNDKGSSPPNSRKPRANQKKVYPKKGQSAQDPSGNAAPWDPNKIYPPSQRSIPNMHDIFAFPLLGPAPTLTPSPMFSPSPAMVPA